MDYMKSNKLLPGLNLFVIPIIITLLIVSFYLQKQIEGSYRNDIGKSLDTVLESTVQALLTWSTKERSATLTWANTAQLKTIAEELAQQYANHKGTDLVNSRAQKTLRKWLLPVIRGKGYRGYFIIGPGNINLASSRDGNIGHINLLAESSEFLNRLWDGETILSIPIKSDVVLKDSLGIPLKEQNSIFVGAPIRDAKNEIIALFTFRLDPTQDYYPILERGRIGETGESYALSREGVLLSRSRFNDQLTELDLLQRNQPATLNLQVTDPGVNLLTQRSEAFPFEKRRRTKMAVGIYEKGQGSDWVGYRDYRGVSVIGSWRWDDRLGYGVTSEIDIEEAFSTLVFIRMIITLFTIAVTLLLIAMVFIFSKSHRDLVKSETQIRLLIDNLPNLVYLKSLDGGLVLANKAVNALKRSKTLPSNASVAISFEDGVADFINEKDGAVVDSHKPIEFKQPLQINKKEKTYLTTKFPLLDECEELFGIGGIHTDITDLVEAKKQLADKELYLRTIMESAAEGIITASANGIVLSFNRYAEKLFGYKPDEVLGKNVSMLMSGDVAELHNGYLEKHIETGISYIAGMGREVLALRKDGVEFLVHLSISSVEIENEKIFTGILHDLTDLYDARSSLEELNQDLEQRVLARTEEAELANKAKGDFLANMSHEIRTPLNAVVGLSHLLGQTNLDAKQRDYLSKIGRSSRTLLGIINDILDFSKIEAGKLDIEVVDFCFDDIFVDLTTLVAEKIYHKNVEMLFDVDKNLPTFVQGDPLRLRQILINLTNNAEKFTENGEIVLAVKVLPRMNNEIWVEFCVKDSGIGMTEEQQNRLFSAFTQADTSTSRVYGGTGLGLTICKQLVQLMGGEMSLHSKPGEGSVFTFTLPFLDSKKEMKDKYLDDRMNDIRVLVVDDNETSLNVISSMLEEFTSAVKATNSATKAIEILQAGEEYDLVLMDFKMPGMNGLDASESIKNSADISRIPIIIMISSYESSNVLDKRYESILDGFLSKPIMPLVLKETIQALLTGDEGRLSYAVASDKNRKEYHFNSRILVVEDNKINQQITQELLESTGAIVSVAENGEVALNMLAEENFDLVLMDIQMPVMDGYTATQKIRENPKYNCLPIIAMTANAMKSDIDRCFEAGMNDHVAKPIDPEKVFSAIEKWSANQKEHGKNESTDHMEVQGEDVFTPFVLDGFDTSEGVRRVGNRWHRYRKLLLGFRDEYLTVVGAIADLTDQKKIDELSALTHTLKGVAGNISANVLYNALCELDDGLQDQRFDDLPMLAAKVEGCLVQALAVIAKL